jgi:hypothetical protein
MKVFKALQPVVDSLLGDLDKKLPDLEKFANLIADKLVKQIPKWVATAKRELPPLIDKVKEFFLEATKFSDGAVKALGPDGLITTGIAAIGFKIGGLKGALAGALTKGFSDVGLGPFESLLAGAVGSAILAGLAEGLASQAALALIAAFKTRMIAASSIPTPIPGGGGGGGGIPPILPTGAGAAGATGVAGLAASLAAPLAVVAAGAVAMTGLFALGGKLLTGGKSVEEREKEWAEWERSIRPPSFGGKFNDSMSAKYSSPNFNVYVGADAVADAVVPVIAKDVRFTPRGR